MDSNQYNEYNDASWRHVSRDGHLDDCSTIKFRNNKRNARFKGFLKGVAFILVAAVSGGTVAYYVVDTKYSKLSLVYGQNNPSMLEQAKTNTPTTDIPKNSITMVAETVGPTVVGISNKLETFFGEKTNGSGSGIIFDKKGYIVTNYHVIQGAEKVTVKLPNTSKIFEAKFIGAEASRDIAVIKIDADSLPVAKFGDSSKVKTGDLSIAIGNPLGDEFAGSVTAGIISAVNRNISIQDRTGKVTTRYKVLQTDAAINPGNSGGALCNEAGEIIGINSLKLGSDDNVEGMGFAITINDVKDIVSKIMSGVNATAQSSTPDKQPTSKEQPNVLIGIQGRSAVPEADSGVKGVYVEEVTPNSGASAAGIKPSDIIVEIDKVKIDSMQQLQELLKKYKAGDSVSCKIWRNGKAYQAKITLSEKSLK
ncbi:trypsin-like peptidase domain-containing protein [Clostridium sp. YIM B02515]|uniref:Trypsin-like peptidase domain-containing protein n=1 Tax=Clostridium rhizosphaerae TaxID=2803861 RepID=A0ABS1TDQ8_9CLOT|nr:trypsin-like peptidase domain-containing protein [Clostridium rhizosphaerae]MBL4936907.1 trypsin-like peptidase domain-containing protein [Clostridium rhizosphaerae]